MTKIFIDEILQEFLSSKVTRDVKSTTNALLAALIQTHQNDDQNELEINSEVRQKLTDLLSEDSNAPIVIACVTEILRIEAPRTKFSTIQLDKYFKAVVMLQSQIEFFGALARMYSCKSVVLVFDSGKDISLRLFERLLSCQTNNPLVIDICCILIEEDELNVEFVNLLFRNLNETTLVKSVLFRCKDIIHVPIAVHFSNTVANYFQLQETNSSNDESLRNQLNEIRLLHSAINNLVEIDEVLILSLLPQLELELHLDNVEVRKLGLDSLTTILRCVDVRRKYMRCFECFLKIRKDSDTSIRLELIKNLKFFLNNFNDLAENAIADLLMDLEEQVRLECCRLVYEFNSRFSDTFLTLNVLPRVKDKCESIRNIAISIVMMLYKRSSSEKLCRSLLNEYLIPNDDLYSDLIRSNQDIIKTYVRLNSKSKKIYLNYLFQYVGNRVWFNDTISEFVKADGPSSLETIPHTLKKFTKIILKFGKSNDRKLFKFLQDIINGGDPEISQKGLRRLSEKKEELVPIIKRCIGWFYSDTGLYFVKIIVGHECSDVASRDVLLKNVVEFTEFCVKTDPKLFQSIEVLCSLFDNIKNENGDVLKLISLVTKQYQYPHFKMVFDNVKSFLLSNDYHVQKYAARIISNHGCRVESDISRNCTEALMEWSLTTGSLLYQEDEISIFFTEYVKRPRYLKYLTKLSIKFANVDHKRVISTLLEALNDNDNGNLRSTAAKCLLKLSTVKDLDEHSFEVLVKMSLDSCFEVRSVYVFKVISYLSKFQIHSKYVLSLLLTAFDDDEIREPVREFLRSLSTKLNESEKTRGVMDNLFTRLCLYLAISEIQPDLLEGYIEFFFDVIGLDSEKCSYYYCVSEKLRFIQFNSKRLKENFGSLSGTVCNIIRKKCQVQKWCLNSYQGKIVFPKYFLLHINRTS